jgi:hypothetical protein
MRWTAIFVLKLMQHTMVAMGRALSVLGPYTRSGELSQCDKPNRKRITVKITA